MACAYCLLQETKAGLPGSSSGRLVHIQHASSSFHSQGSQPPLLTHPPPPWHPIKHPVRGPTEADQPNCILLGCGKGRASERAAWKGWKGWKGPRKAFQQVSLRASALLSPMRRAARKVARPERSLTLPRSRTPDAIDSRVGRAGREFVRGAGNAGRLFQNGRLPASYYDCCCWRSSKV
jgi:hypothetical protein